MVVVICEGLQETLHEQTSVKKVNFFDKMHMRGHVDSWCKATSDPHLHSYIDNVSICLTNPILDELSSMCRLIQRCVNKPLPGSQNMAG